MAPPACVGAEGRPEEPGRPLLGMNSSREPGMFSERARVDLLASLICGLDFINALTEVP